MYILEQIAYGVLEGIFDFNKIPDADYKEFIRIAEYIQKEGKQAPDSNYTIYNRRAMNDLKSSHNKSVELRHSLSFILDPEDGVLITLPTTLTADKLIENMARDFKIQCPKKWDIEKMQGVEIIRWKQLTYDTGSSRITINVKGLQCRRGETIASYFFYIKIKKR